MQWLLLLFLVMFSASFSGSEDVVLFDSVVICKCFMQYSNFAHKLNLQLWMETRLVNLITIEDQFYNEQSNIAEFEIWGLKKL